MKPFDLEAAKDGDPIVCRDGTPAKFIAHVPEAREPNRLVVLINETVVVCYENGSRNSYGNASFSDLFMAPKKRTMWVNLYSKPWANYYSTQHEADAVATPDRIGGRAWPVEIEE